MDFIQVMKLQNKSSTKMEELVKDVTPKLVKGALPLSNKRVEEWKEDETMIGLKKQGGRGVRTKKNPRDECVHFN